MITPRIIVEPVKEAVSLAEAKSQLKLDDPPDAGLLAKMNAELTLYIRGARKYVEKKTGWAIHEQTLELALDDWFCGPPRYAGYRGSYVDGLILPRATPLISVESIEYIDSDGVTHTWDPPAYIVDTYSIPGRIVPAYGETFPSFTPYPVAPIRIKYKSGIATTSPATEADETLKIPILMLTAGLWSIRESEVITDEALIAELARSYGVEAWIRHNVHTFVF